MVFPVWLHFLHHTQAVCGALLGALLTQAKIRAGPMPDPPRGPGLLLFERVDAALLDLLRASGAQARVLAVCVGAGELAACDMWAVLEAGAADLLRWSSEPVCACRIVARLQRWEAVQRLLESNAVSTRMAGDSEAWRRLLESVVEVAAFSPSNVLITGETGTGKDLIAQLIHQLSGCNGQLIVVDCTTLSPELSGSELFGHEKGAFTGAASARDGAFALADGGVLFLDEVGELPPPLQAQLLRAVQEHQYKRVGSNTWQRARFRLVCATHRDLDAAIADGSFRADLYYRIAAWRCSTPPLRERRCDILPLVTFFLARLAPAAANDADGAPFGLDPAVRDYLLTRDYPGNVRELRQTVTRIWHRHSGPGPLTIGDLPPEDRLAVVRCKPAWPDAAFEAAVRHALDLGVNLSRIGQAAADVAIGVVLEQEDGNNQRAARRLGITARALQLRRKAQVPPFAPVANGAEERRL